jgi:hypothetical protein
VICTDNNIACFQDGITTIIVLNRIIENNFMKLAVLVNHGYAVACSCPDPVLRVANEGRNIIRAKIRLLLFIKACN